MLRVTLISPEGSVFEGDADSVVVPAHDGEVGILPRHAPFMTLLGSGKLVVRRAGEENAFSIEGGFMQVTDDTVRIVTEHARKDAA
jgi:F-type H+-transporting ATPase subunit epsilon